MKKQTRHKETRRRLGFTLAELLVVVGIISILSAIALPNFLEAQTRAKISRAKAEMRAIATALESYHVDHNLYPAWMDKGEEINPVSRRLVPLTTPIAYMTSVPSSDPFKDRRLPEAYDTYDYVDAESFARAGDPEPSFRSRGAEWRINSAGPDCFNTYGGPSYMNPFDNPGYDYDPTNGTISKGDIVRVGPKSSYAGNQLYPDKVE
jgi:prepilin-type N-terminal cleavage/methylation domain-containing protein